ncbi:hypothetical protein KUTeg_020933 [Tegillarca granosa]|uniref:MRH domain-containing protein n=1 Tax=Tegillarca granosa TaxID=220873 RepID=A0ABQ9EDL8_TEGGR|nr:hypothetical protein KUTeg_020933 [Tegillarca granosa]
MYLATRKLSDIGIFVQPTKGVYAIFTYELDSEFPNSVIRVTMTVHTFSSFLWRAAVLSIALLSSVSGDSLPTCQPKDFHYEYTECDSEGGRWRVSVPKPDTCTGGAPNPPVRGKTYTCDPGRYLDLSNQECKPCSAGTYSMGGGVRFDDWDTLPSGFTAKSENFAFSSSFMPNDNADEDQTNCSRSEWVPHGSYISSLPGDCASQLTYSALLVKDGTLTYEYQYTDSEAIFHFVIKNNECQSYSSHTNQWPDITSEGKFKEVKVHLKKGLNVLTWKTIGVYNMDEAKRHNKPIRIRKIEITGVAYTSQCTNCKAGTYSSDGAAMCTPCQENSYSDKGSSQCKPCDAKTEYSSAGSSKCLKRPPCEKRDYYVIEGHCDENGKTRKEYKWVMPQICRTDLPESIKLPEKGEPKDCPPCNPGMESIDGNCTYCQAGQYSDGAKCKACPASTSPNYGLSYQWWNTLPENMTSDCITFTESDCLEDSRWMVAGDHITTHYGRLEDNYLILMMKVSGFRSQESKGKETEVGTLKFVFETNCIGDCQLLLLSDELTHNSIVKEFTGTKTKQEFVHSIKQSKPITFTWAFQHSTAEEAQKDNTRKYLDDFAKIYSIEVTNTIEGGATSCLKCPKGVQKNGCVPCPSGFYVEETAGNAECKQCPENTVVKNGLSYGADSCKPCGPGLHPKDGDSCVSDCKFTTSRGQEIDFTVLDGFHSVDGSKLFTASGTQYFHGFNFTLCQNKAGKATCYNNASSGDNAKAAPVSAMVCRNTMIPSRGNSAIVSTQPVSLGDYLEKIVSNSTDQLKKQYQEEGFSTEGIERDIHFYYKSDRATPACPKGRTTIISLRCDLKEEGNGEIHLPPKCSDGTCDGCLFHFMWLTEHACPVCQKEDYKRIAGECVKGEQIIHYTSPKNCLVKDEEKKKCTVKFDSFPIAIAVPVVVGVAILLLGLIVYCWCQNKSLEYKYMKLVHDNGPNYDGELPGVDSCALEDGEEEQFDSVGFKESRAPKFFKKLRGKKREDDNPFETSHTEKIPLT